MLRSICCCLNDVGDNETDDGDTDVRSSVEPPPAYSSLDFGRSYGTMAAQVGFPKGHT
jgi:hypothetical protein